MRYGYATGFATPVRDRVDYTLLENIKLSGYDFVEFPLMLLASQPLEECGRAAERIRELGLTADSCCNMFPASQRITGPKRDWKAADTYLKGAFERMKLLGVRKIVFGSTGARNLPQGTSQEEGYRQVADFVHDIVVPYLERDGVVLCMEPIGAYEANFIRTLDDGMRVVRAVNHPQVRLLADSVHLLYENEDPQVIKNNAPFLEHIHLCESKRALPLGQVSPGLQAILEAIRAIGYDKTVSFEPMPYDACDMKAALDIIKAYLE